MKEPSAYRETSTHQKKMIHLAHEKQIDKYAAKEIEKNIPPHDNEPSLTHHVRIPKNTKSCNQEVVSHFLNYLLPIPAHILLIDIHKFPNLLHNIVCGNNISQSRILVESDEAL